MLEKFKEKLQEILFLSNPDSQILRTILFFHAINLSQNLTCTGLLEDDPEDETYILPQSWDTSLCDIYSFRYKVDNFTLYFKLNYDNPTDTLEINVLSSSNTGKILTHQVPNINKINFSDDKQTEILISSYLKNLLEKILVSTSDDKSEKSTKKKEANVIHNDPLRIVRNEPPPPSFDFWRRPQQNPNLFGDYGSSDLRPGGIPEGNLLGPNNPFFLRGGVQRPDQNPNNPYLFGGGQRPDQNPNDPFSFGGEPNFGRGPNIRFDPFGPGGINGSFGSYDSNGFM